MVFYKPPPTCQQHQLGSTVAAAVAFSTSFSFRIRLSSRHRGPFLVSTHKRGEKTTRTRAQKVYVQPRPIALNIDSIKAVPAAPNRHRTRLFAATAVAGASA